MEDSYPAYFNQFRQNAKEITSGPRQDRTCNDKCCYIFFVSAMLAFIIMGAFMINDQRDYFTAQFNGGPPSGLISSSFSNYSGIILGMFALSLIMAILYVILIKNCPRGVVYGMLLLAFLTVLAIFILSLAYAAYGLAIAMAIILIIMVLLIYCFWDRIKVGIILLQASADFITQKPTVFGSNIWVFLLAFLFFIFWLISVIATQMSANTKDNNGQSITRQNGFYGYFIFMYIFMGYIFYYVLAFLVASACAVWYYNLNEGYFCTGVGRINKYHLGSFTFAAIVITIVKIARLLLQKQNNSRNIISTIICCICQCILAQIQAFLNFLNNNAIIVMAITGQSYLDSAKTTLSLVFKQITLFWAVQAINTVIQFGGVVLCVAIPTIIGILVARKEYDRTPSDEELATVGFIIFFVSILLVIFIIGTLGESLSSIFIFFCLDQSLRECGYQVSNCPIVIKHFLNYQDRDFAQNNNRMPSSNQMNYYPSGQHQSYQNNR